MLMDSEAFIRFCDDSEACHQANAAATTVSMSDGAFDADSAVVFFTPKML